ncbi:MAG TPA: cytochrome c oxidase subunit I [Burkholderiaceae bacterium]|nr:cytochrome c oxidase subunit I [Burkholderiaceae bacterium]
MKTERSALARHEELEAVWGSRPGLGHLASVNHTTVGKRFIVASLIFFLIGGVLAMLIRTQLATSSNAFMEAGVYAQVFTMHGTVMMFLFAIPMLEGFSFYLLPKMLGARDMAYPRLGAYAWYCYLFGASMVLLSMLLGLAPASGWFMYTPLSSARYSPGIANDFWLIGITFAEISAVCGAVELVATILRMRAPGMKLTRMPLFAWYMLVTAAMMLLGFPPLILGSILLELERAFGWPFYDPALGGDPVLWQHLFWLFGHPEVYIIFVPAAGMVTVMVATFASRPIVAYRWVVASVVSIGILSMVLWAHHMFTVGLSLPSSTFFSVASTLIAIPTSLQFFIWIATLWCGRVRREMPMLFLAGFFITFIIGGLTGVMIALVPFNLQVHDTHFIVAHLHYVLVGGMVFPVLAAAYYWLPHFTGRMPARHLGKVSFWLIFLGFHLTFLPMHLTGLAGMPRRVHSYSVESGWDLLNLVSSIGGFMQAVGFAVFVIDIVMHIRVGRVAPRNPWGAGTLEWAMPTPAPSYNFASIPEVRDVHPLWEHPEIPDDAAAGKYWLSEPAGGQRLTLSVEVSSGRPENVIVLPGSSWWPLLAALATAGFFTGVLLKFYLAALCALAITIALFLCWAWANGSRLDVGEIEANAGVHLPLHFEYSDGAPGWHGTVYTLVADAAVLGSLLFGAIYLWVLAPNWPPPVLAQVPVAVLPGLAIAWALAFVGSRIAQSLMGAEPRNVRATAGLGLQGLALLVALGLVAWGLAGLPAAGDHAQYALCSALLWYAAIHLGIALIMTGFLKLRWRAGFVSARRTLEPRVVGLFVHYSFGASLLCAGLAALMGR